MSNLNNFNCPITQRAMERNKAFFLRDNGIKEVKLDDHLGNQLKCKNCGAIRFKLYAKFGGKTYDKKGALSTSVPVKYNFSCKCGKMLVITEEMFKYTKVTYGCRTQTCPDKKTKMDKKCLECKFIYEK